MQPSRDPQRARLRAPIPARTARRALALLLGSLAVAAAGAAAETLRVGTSGDYPPFSERRDNDYRGFDIALARAYAADRGMKLEFVPFRWPKLLAGLEGGHFDVAFSGVTVRPERSAAGRFSVPVAESGAVALASTPERWNDAEALDRPHIRIAVNAGGHLERVARERFPRATLVAIPDNAAVLQALLDDQVDAVVTDTAEARLWREQAKSTAIFGPLTRDRKAPLVRADRAELAADLDDWLVDRELDGTLAALRREHLGESGGAAVAHPLSALLAAMDERLALMPSVGVVKRRSGLPLEVPEREEVVLDAATEAVLAAAAARDVKPPSVLLIRELFRAQLEAAKQVQWDALRDPDVALPDPLPDLEGALRPALLRIGERIARLLARLPDGLERRTIRAVADDELRSAYLSAASKTAIAEALADFAGAPKE